MGVLACGLLLWRSRWRGILQSVRNKGQPTKENQQLLDDSGERALNGSASNGGGSGNGSGANGRLTPGVGGSGGVSGRRGLGQQQMQQEIYMMNERLLEEGRHVVEHTAASFPQRGGSVDDLTYTVQVRRVL
jgi:hypothetical protein